MTLYVTKAVEARNPHPLHKPQCYVNPRLGLDKSEDLGCQRGKMVLVSLSVVLDEMEFAYEGTKETEG